MPFKSHNSLELTFALRGADGGDGPGETEPLSLQLALLPTGALLEDFDHSILFQELGMKHTDPEHNTEHSVRPLEEYRRVQNGEVGRCVPALHLLMTVIRQEQVFVKTAVG